MIEKLELNMELWTIVFIIVIISTLCFNVLKDNDRITNKNYFVSYVYQDQNNNLGYGNIWVSGNGFNVTHVKADIIEEYGFKWVSITWFKELKGYEVYE